MWICIQEESHKVQGSVFRTFFYHVGLCFGSSFSSYLLMAYYMLDFMLSSESTLIRLEGRVASYVVCCQTEEAGNLKIHHKKCVKAKWVLIHKGVAFGTTMEIVAWGRIRTQVSGGIISNTSLRKSHSKYRQHRKALSSFLLRSWIRNRIIIYVWNYFFSCKFVHCASFSKR